MTSHCDCKESTNKKRNIVKQVATYVAQRAVAEGVWTYIQYLATMV